MPRTIVTAAPPNPNGDLHLGHLAGPFLTADIVARALAIRGEQVSHVGYIDEHSSYVVRRGRELDADPYTTAAVLGDRIEATLRLANMLPTTMVRPLRDPSHDALVQRSFLQLLEDGHVRIEEQSPVHWCETCERELYECEVRGGCEFCGAPSDGVYCEQCGMPQVPTHLVDPVCTKCHGSDISVTHHPRMLLDIEQVRPELRAIADSVDARPRLRAYLDTLLGAPLAPVPVSRIGTYGIRVPLEGWEAHFLDTWFSGLFGYVNAATLDERRYRRFDVAEPWLDTDVDVVEAFGFDCSFSHVVLWNALSIWLGWPTRSNYLSNEFFQLEGKKFSTSRGYAIWGGEFLPTTSSDILRFSMALDGPETAETSFSLQDYEAFAERYRAGILAVFEAATDPEPPAQQDDAALQALMATLTDRVAPGFTTASFSARAAAAAIVEIVLDGAPELVAALGTAGIAARQASWQQIAEACYPFSPYWTTEQLTQLGRLPAIAMTALTPPAATTRHTGTKGGDGTITL